MSCAPSEDSDQSLSCPHEESLTEDWSNWADAKADLSLRWAHTHFVGFVMLWLRYSPYLFHNSYSIATCKSWKFFCLGIFINHTPVTISRLMALFCALCVCSMVRCNVSSWTQPKDRLWWNTAPKTRRWKLKTPSTTAHWETQLSWRSLSQITMPCVLWSSRTPFQHLVIGHRRLISAATVSQHLVCRAIAMRM